MALTFRDYSTIVSAMVAAAQAECPDLTDLTPGSAFLALLYAGADNAVHGQFIAAQVAKMTRLSTSTGSDIDTFVNDYGMSRNAAVPAQGTVTFSRAVAGFAALVPVGAQVKSTDMSQTFTVVAPALTNPNFDPVADGYTIAADALSVNASVVAAVGGSVGNVQAGVISVLATSISAVDSVTNAAALVGGTDAESDQSVVARFPTYISNRSLATNGAVAYAIQSSHPGVSFQIVENKNASGSGQAGSFLAYINNAGSTDPNSALIQSVKTAVDAVRPVSVTFGVLPATILPVSVALSITVQPGYDKINVVIPAVISAVQSYINGLGVGNAVRYSVLGSVAQLVEGVQYIELLSVNDGTIDVGGDPTTIVQSFAVTVS